MRKEDAPPPSFYSLARGTNFRRGKDAAPHYHYEMFPLLVLLWCADLGGRAEYIGGTLAGLGERAEGRVMATDPDRMLFRTKSSTVDVPYRQINLLEYGQKADRRYLSAVLISPVFLLAKKRTHFLTVGYSDEQGQQQAMVFRVEKGDVRALLASLEARTGLRVQFQDHEARKAAFGSK